MKFKYLFIIFILLFVFMALAKADISPPEMNISGPDVVGTSQKFQYTIEFNSNAYDSYGYSAIIAGENLTGAGPLTELVGNSTDKTFVLNFTSPESAQNLYLYVVGYGMINDKAIRVECIVKIRIIEPIVFTVNVSNNEDTILKDIPVNFYVDNKYIGNTTINKLYAQGTETVEYIWTFDSLSNGEHTLTVELMNNNIVFGDTGTQKYSQIFYYGVEESDFTWIFYVIIIVIISIFLLSIMNKKDKKKSTPKWKK